MDKVKFAIVGCGRIASAHIDAINKVNDAQLVTVCDIAPEKAKKVANDCGLNRYYTKIEDMLISEEIDVVNVCTPSGTHCDIVVAAAKNGKHVLCEKPLDVTKEKMDYMIKVCKEEGVILGGIFQRRSNSAAIHTRNAIKEGILGKIVLASASLKSYRDQEYYDSGDWRGTWELDGGGALMNQGIHGIDLLQWMVGDIESVFGRCATFARDIDVEDTAVISVKFDKGFFGTIEGATSVYPGQDTIFTIHGEKGTVSFGDKGFYIYDIMDNDQKPPEISDGLGGINCGWTDTNAGHIKQIEDFVEAIRNNTQPMVSGEDAKKVVEVILGIYESSKQGKEILL